MTIYRPGTFLDWGVQFNISRFFNSWFNPNGNKSHFKPEGRIKNSKHPNKSSNRKENRKHKHYHRRKIIKDKNIIYIDLKKLEDLCFSNEEKKQIKCVLNNIRYANNKKIPSNNIKSTNRQNISAKKLKITASKDRNRNKKIQTNHYKPPTIKEPKFKSPTLIPNVTQTVSNEVGTKNNLLKQHTKIVGNKQNKHNIVHIDKRKECKKCKSKLSILKENKTVLRRKQRNYFTILSVSEEKHLNSLTKVDYRGCGDISTTTKEQFYTEDSLREFLKGNTIASTKTAHVRFHRPTYVVHYNEEEREEPEKTYKFSDAAFESHLGHIPCPNVRNARESQVSRNVGFHYDDKEQYMICVDRKVDKTLRQEEVKTDGAFDRNQESVLESIYHCPDLKKDIPQRSLSQEEIQKFHQTDQQYLPKNKISLENVLSDEVIPSHREWEPYSSPIPKDKQVPTRKPNAKTVDNKKSQERVETKNKYETDHKEGYCKTLKRLLIGCLGLDHDEETTKELFIAKETNGCNKRLMELKQRRKAKENKNAHAIRTIREEVFKSMENKLRHKKGFPLRRTVSSDH